MPKVPDIMPVTDLRQDAAGALERQLLHLLARGDKEIASGEEYDLDVVLKEADALLARLRK